MRGAVIFLALALPCAAMAEPWHGDWALDPEWCVNADQIGEVSPGPLRWSAEAMIGGENNCKITQTVPLGHGATRLALTCEAEGDSYEDHQFLMVHGDRLWVWYAAGEFKDAEMVEFYRCPA